MTNNNWELVKLGDILNFKTGRLDSNAATLNGEYPFFTCSPETLSINSYAFDDEAVLLAGNNANGVFSVKYYIGKFNAYQRTYVITSKDRNLVSIRWLYFRIKHVTAELQKMSVGTATKFLTKKILDNFEIRLPTLIEQESIANILWSLQSQIDINIQINQTLESIAQAIFKSWFIDFDPVRAKIAAKQEGKDPERAAMCAISGKTQAELDQLTKEDFAELQATAALFPDELVESELGEVPKGWEYKKLKDLCRVINGRAYKNTEFKEEGIPIVRIQNLTGGGKTVFSDLDLPQDKLIEKEDFIYAWSATFGPYIWRGPKSIYHYHIWKMDVDETIISRYFLYLTMFRKTESMKSAGTGSIFTHLTKVIMESQDVLIADNAINMLFKDRIDKIFKLISLKSDEIKNLENIRDTLLPKLLSGEVDVTTLADTKNSSDKEQIA